MTLIVIFKMARRMLISDDDIEDEVVDMYNTLADFDKTLDIKLGIRNKSSIQIKYRLLHLRK